MYYFFTFLFGIGCGIGLTIFAAQQLFTLFARGTLRETAWVRRFMTTCTEVWLEERKRGEPDAINRFFKHLFLFDDEDGTYADLEKDWAKLSAHAKNVVRRDLLNRLRKAEEDGYTFDPITVFQRIDALDLGKFVPKDERDAMMERLILAHTGDLTGTDVLRSATLHWKPYPPENIMRHLVDGGLLYKLVHEKRMNPATIKEHMVHGLRTRIMLAADAVHAMRGTLYDTPENMDAILLAAAETGNLNALESYYCDSEVPENLLRMCMGAARSRSERNAAKCCILLDDRATAEEFMRTMEDDEALGIVAKFLRTTPAVT